MEFKGTKGDWCFEKNKTFDGREFLSIFKNGKHIDENSIAGIWSLSEEDFYNAKLISCAPEMLEMLNSIVKQIEIENVSEHLIDLKDKAEELIEKATTI